MTQRSHRTDDRGAAAVEFALVVLPLITILFGIIEFGWIFNQQVSVTNAARESARYYAVHAADPLVADPIAAARTAGRDAAPTVAAANWSGTGNGIAITQGCDPTKPNYDAALDTAAGGKTVSVRATVPMPRLTGMFAWALDSKLTGNGKTICGG